MILRIYIQVLALLCGTAFLLMASGLHGLLLPLRGPDLGAGMGGEPPRAANDSVIEGEFSRVDDPKKRLPGDQ